MNLARVLLVLGVLVCAASAACWFLAGAHPGWSRTYIEIEKTDPVTNIVFREKVDRFVPGIELLAAGCGLGAACIFSGVVILGLRRINKA